MRRKIEHIVYLLLLVALVLPSGCSTIDDDRSDCPEDIPTPPPGPEPPAPKDSCQLDYELRLVTNMSTELYTELTTQTEISVAEELRTHLAAIFTDFAHDVDLSFYDTVGDSVRLQHDQHLMDANQASYTLNLPKRQYMHLAVANVVDNHVVSLVNDTQCHTSQLLQETGDTISSHTTGLFTARLPMEILEGVDQEFNVHLYMANCATTLVIDTIGSGIRDLKVYTTGFATGFNIADSTYLYIDTPPIVCTVPVATDVAGQQTFCSVSFPSPEVPSTRTVIETTDPFVSPESENSLWEYRVYATTATGSVTESILYVKSPLRAGQLKVIKAKMYANGSTESDDRSVAISVTLDWNPGGSYNPIL